MSVRTGPSCDHIAHTCKLNALPVVSTVPGSDSLQVLGGQATGRQGPEDASTADAASEQQQQRPNPSAITFAPQGSGHPSVLFVMGANGMGKTTTIGKIASRLRSQNDLKVRMIWGDTCVIIR